MLSCCKLLGIRSFVSKVWSQVLHQEKKKNVILCSEKKGQGPKAQLSPCEVQVLAKRKKVSVGSSLSARSPALHPAVIPEKARSPGPNWPSGSLGHPNRRGWSQADCCCLWVTEAGMATAHVADHAMITQLPCTGHMTDHAVITWLSCTDHETDHALITSISCTDHMTAHALITWMIIH